MFAKFLIGALLFVAISARSIDWGGEISPYQSNGYLVPYEEYGIHESGHSRVRRQSQVEPTGKAILASNDEKMLSVIRSRDPASGMTREGVAFDHVNGHGASVMKQSIPGFGDKVTGAGHMTVFHNDNHDLKANAFVSRTMPDNSQMPNFNTVGGGVDYTYKDKIGASLGMSRTPLFDKTDYSAKGNLNLFRTPTSSLDFGAGVQRFETPHFRSSWEPFAGINYRTQIPNFF